MGNELPSNCWYEKVCQQPERFIGGEDNPCVKTDVCPRYLEMRYLMEQSGIPVAKQRPLILTPENVDRNIFCDLADIKDNIVENVRKGFNIYLCSTTPGNGKTSWAIKMLLKYFDEIWNGNGFKTRALFVHVPTFLLEYKNFENRSPKILALNELIPIVDLVVWDDIGCTAISNYDLSLLTMYIDQRVLSEKANIYTGNLTTKADLDKILGDRLRSRIWNTSQVFEFKGHDRREG